MKNRSHRRLFVARGVLLSLLALLLMACTGYGTNPLGYGYAYDQMASPIPRSIAFPTVTPVKNPDPLLKQGGLGNTLDTFFAKYTPMAISHPPTQYAFQQTVDRWPGGSILFAEFENGAQDRIPRAVQFSLVPGTNHPTTYEQAEAFAQSLLPADRTGPVTVQALDTSKGKCLVMVWNSPDLAKTFPPEDFLGGTSGKLGKPGDVVVSFFPHVAYSSTYPDEPLNQNGGSDDVIDNPNIIGSLLIALGERPSCSAEHLRGGHRAHAMASFLTGSTNTSQQASLSLSLPTVYNHLSKLYSYCRTMSRLGSFPEPDAGHVTFCM